MGHEASREGGATYSVMNLRGLFALATSAVADDLWTWRSPSGRGSIKAALDYLLLFATNASNPWPFSEDGKTTEWSAFPWTELAPLMRRASIVFGEEAYEQAIAKLPWKSPKQTREQGLAKWQADVIQLLWPRLTPADIAPVHIEAGDSAGYMGATGNVSGSLDGVARDTAVGWAANDADPLLPVTVRFYLDAPCNHSAAYIGSTQTEDPRPDLGMPGNHGYTFVIPDRYLDNSTHTLYACGVAQSPAGGSVLVPLITSPKTTQFGCGFVMCPTIAMASNDGQVSVQTLGHAEYVFRHSIEGCSPFDGADSPARAFRDAEGRVILTAATANNTYRSVGPTLGTVKRSCASGPVMETGNHTDYVMLQDMEWPTAPFSTDGTHVYVLIHNEWHHPEIMNTVCTPGAAWVNGITMAVSTDGGRKFFHPPDYKVRVPPAWNDAFPCNSSLGVQMGSFEPSNIVARSDGYFYAVFGYMSAPVAPYTSGCGAVIGDCVMRTSDLSKGSAWRVRVADGTWSRASETESCAVLNNDAGLDLKTISYNTYLQKYIAVGDHSGAGYGYALSENLIDWSPMVQFLKAPIDQGPTAYISLLDPTDSSRDFGRSGAEPYVYLNLIGLWPNYDIVRQQIRITNLTTLVPIKTEDNSQDRGRPLYVCPRGPRKHHKFYTCTSADSPSWLSSPVVYVTSDNRLLVLQ
jgi:hypothetical protein